MRSVDRRGLGTVILALLGSAFVVTNSNPRGIAAEPPTSTKTASRAEQLLNCETPVACMKLAVEIYFLEKPPRALAESCMKRMETEFALVETPLISIFPSLPPDRQTEALDLFYKNWNQMVAIASNSRKEMVREALDSPDPRVREGGARIMAEYPLVGIYNIAIDAAETDPRLTLAALMAIERAPNGRATRWVSDQLLHPHPEIRQQATRTIYTIGAESLAKLRERLLQPDPKVNQAGLLGLLILAHQEDLPALQRWLQENPGAPVELRSRAVEAAAAIEAGSYQPVIPPRPPLVFSAPNARR